jgi:nitrous oxidase accessory protein NosD
MKKLAWYVAVVLLLAVVSPHVVAAQGGRPDLLVDDDKVQCPTATFTSIQDAINAANPGATIRVCPGVYAEQLSISKSLSIQGDSGAVLLPGTLAVNATGSSGGAIAAAILVRNAINVEISGLIVDTANNGITSCSTDLIGILFQNASGAIEHNAVRNAKLSTALNGCQSGNGIVVQTLGVSGGLFQVRITDNSVHDYQKNGITANESGTEANVVGNVVTGSGPNPAIAQNGIQIGFGGTGRIERNTVAGNIDSSCVSPSNCTANGTGILVFESDNVRVEGNSVVGNQVGIFSNGNHTTIDANGVSDSVTLVGIDLAGDNGVASANDVTSSGQAAIFLEGNDNRVLGNEFTDAPVGILISSGTVGNVHSGNSYFAVLVKVQDPLAQKMVRVGPKR